MNQAIEVVIEWLIPIALGCAFIFFTRTKKEEVYIHYKGGLYLLLHRARMSEQREIEMVVYQSVLTGLVWVRPFDKPLLEGDDCFNDMIQWPDGKVRRRFVPLEEWKRGGSE